MFYVKSFTLQGTDISHLGKRKIIFKMPLKGDMLVFRRVVTLMSTIFLVIRSAIFMYFYHFFVFQSSCVGVLVWSSVFGYPKELPKFIEFDCNTKSNNLENKLLLISINLNPPKNQQFSCNCLKKMGTFRCFAGTSTKHLPFLTPSQFGALSTPTQTVESEDLSQNTQANTSTFGGFFPPKNIKLKMGPK